MDKREFHWRVNATMNESVLVYTLCRVAVKKTLENRVSLTNNIL